MRWPSRRGKRPTEAEKAVRESQERLDETRAQTPAIRALAADLRRVREQNHFAERLRAALEGGPQ